MIGEKVYQRLVGREINVFGTKYDEAGDLLVIKSGRLIGAEDGALILVDAEDPDDQAVTIIDLRLVGMVEPVAPEAPLKAMNGGRAKVARLSPTRSEEDRRTDG